MQENLQTKNNARNVRNVRNAGNENTRLASGRMLVIELNEAEKYFLDKFIAEEKLPTFKKFLQQGKQLETRISGWNPSEENAWQQINPRTVWPSIYTGIPAKELQIIGYGQKTNILQGQCWWDKLNAEGVSTGVFGSLMSSPVRRNPYSLFYIPDSLATSNDCVPESYKPIQELFVYVAQHYSDNMPLTTIKVLWKLLRGVLKGIPLATAYEILAQVPRERTHGIELHRNRALLQARLQMDIFQILYKRYKPAFATLHLNHIAYMQHRYWRAAEPEYYKDDMSDLDSYFFGDIETRKDYEYAFKDAILDSFILTDHFLAELTADLDDNTLLVIMTGLGQKKMDPFNEIHNPEFRFYNLDRLFKLIDITNYKLLTQMNPNITLNFPNASEASLAAYKLSNLKILGEFPLFQIKHLEDQLFLEGNLPPNVWFLDTQAFIEDQMNEHILPLFDFVKVSQVRDQSTAHHRDNGWILFYGNIAPILGAIPAPKPADNEAMDITKISDLLLSYFKNTH